MINDKSAEEIVRGLLAECEDCSERDGRGGCDAIYYCANRDAAALIKSQAAELAELTAQRAIYREAIDIAAKKTTDLDLETCEIGHEGACCPVGHIGLRGATGPGRWDEHSAKLEMIQAVAVSVQGKVMILQKRLGAAQQEMRAAVEESLVEFIVEHDADILLAVETKDRPYLEKVLRQWRRPQEAGEGERDG